MSLRFPATLGVGRRRHRALGATACSTILLLIAALAGPAGAQASVADPAVAALMAAGDSALVRLDLESATAAYGQAHRTAPAGEQRQMALIVERALGIVGVEREGAAVG